VVDACCVLVDRSRGVGRTPVFDTKLGTFVLLDRGLMPISLGVWRSPEGSGTFCVSKNLLASPVLALLMTLWCCARYL